MGIFIENGGIEILYGSLFLFWFVYLYFVKDYGYWEARGVPHIPAVFPFGSMRELVIGTSYFGTAYDKIYREYRDERFVGFTEVRYPCLLVIDPNLIKLILQKDFHHFTDHSWVDINPKEYMCRHLFALKGEEWREMRLKLTPAYTGAKMKMMFFLLKKCSDMLQEALKKRTETNKEVDVKDILARFCTDVIATCAFGVESNSLLNGNSDFYNIGLKSNIVGSKTLLKMYLYHAFPVLTKVHCFDLVDTEIKHFLTTAIRTTVEYREKYNINRYDFLDLLIKLRQNQSILEEGEKPQDPLYLSARPGKREGLTIEEITAETFLFFNAGFETSSNTALFCLYELACSSKIQEKLFQEVEEVLDRCDGEISYQALQEMTYMDQVINECMRRYPIFPFLIRNCTQMYNVPDSNLVIEKGLKIIIPVYSLHHDPQYFPDPYTFDPERFSPETSKTRHPYVFLPLGEGPRMCIGFRFGLMKVKVALATILNDYEVSLTPETEVPLTIKSCSYLTTPKQRLMLEFNKRRGRHHECLQI